MLNRVLLIGNLGRDPERRTTQGGDAVTTFSLATTTRSGEKEFTQWHQVVAFGKLAESCDKFLSKGRQVFVEGRLNYRKWEKDGESREKVEIVADRVQFLGKKDQEPDGNRQQGEDKW